MVLGLILRLSWICFLLFGSSAGYPAPKDGQTSQNTPGLGFRPVPYGGAVSSLVSGAGPSYDNTFSATGGAASGPVYAAAGNLQSEGSRPPLVNLQYVPSVSYQQPEAAPQQASSSTGNQSPSSVGAPSASAASSPNYGRKTPSFSVQPQSAAGTSGNLNMGSGGAASGPVYGAAPAYPAAGYMDFGDGPVPYIGAPAASSSASFYAYGAPAASSSAGSYAYGAPPASSSYAYGAPPASSSYAYAAPPASSSYAYAAPAASSSYAYAAPAASSSAGSYAYGAPAASSSYAYGAPAASSSGNDGDFSPGLPWSMQPAGGADSSFSDPSNWMPSRDFPDFSVWDSNAEMPQSMSETSPLPPSSYIIQSRNGYQRAQEFLSHTKYSPEYPEPPVFAAETIEAPRMSPPEAGPKGGKKV